MISRRKEDEGSELKEEIYVKGSLLAESEISLILDSYDDIFSDFDPRHFSERALSDDFLIEAKKAARDKAGVYELRFLVPKQQRNFEHEHLIRMRLKEHFKKHYRKIQHKICFRFRYLSWVFSLFIKRQNKCGNRCRV